MTYFQPDPEETCAALRRLLDTEERLSLDKRYNGGLTL